MKGILIAAGLGSRLGSLTTETPKCLLRVGSMTMLERQIHAFRANGISDIVVVNGYQADRFPSDLGVSYITNTRYRQNNILNSLMCAEEHLSEGFLASYSDLVYEPSLVGGLLGAPGDIVVSVDGAFKERYAHLDFHPFEAMEKVDYDQDQRVQRIGKGLSSDATAEFVGLVRCSKAGARDFREGFAKAKAQFWGRPFIEAADFERAYLTDLLQYLIDEGTAVHACLAQGQRWAEIDSEEDLRWANALFA